MDTVDSYYKLCSRLRSSSAGLIAIEGFCASGKTWLADQLGRDLPAAVIHVDDYCTPRVDPPSYVEGVDTPRLKHALHNLDSTQLSVVEGICLRVVMARCAVTAKIYVYVKRMDRNELWHDGINLEYYEAENGIHEDDNEPHASDFYYHSTKRPHEQADIIFLRVE